MKSLTLVSILASLIPLAFAQDSVCSFYALTLHSPHFRFAELKFSHPFGYKFGMSGILRPAECKRIPDGVSQPPHLGHLSILQRFLPRSHLYH